MSAFSGRTLTLLGEELTGWTLRTIDSLFQDEGIDLGPASAANSESGQRRGLMRQYLASLDLTTPADVSRLAGVFNTVLLDIAQRGEDGEGQYQRFVAYLRRDGFHVDPATHTLRPPGHRIGEQSLAALPDASAVRDHLRRLDDNIETDPRLAVSVAKDLVESTAKLVLRQCGVTYNPRNDDVSALAARAQEALKLNARGVNSDADGAPATKKLLGAVATLAQGITELRNQVGVGHGRESVPTWVRPRHARLAAGAAHVWCQLMLETLDDPDAPWRACPEVARG